MVVIVLKIILRVVTHIWMERFKISPILKEAVVRFNFMGFAFYY